MYYWFRQKEGGEGRLGGDMLKVNTLKVNTRRHPLSFSAILTHLRPAHAHAHTPAVYRPPSNKVSVIFPPHSAVQSSHPVTLLASENWSKEVTQGT
ncbi:hypothetical protein E2C01_085910 [Portunus trituberculatus]|uniref:Uncharacterized protein n=1 Tax=Portunus trituberculatus TaxID=210409 RepID=A0A5B7JA57_PORTR|nr:hypothetical protein [Portunus trituberculatus]